MRIRAVRGGVAVKVYTRESYVIVIPHEFYGLPDFLQFRGIVPEIRPDVIFVDLEVKAGRAFFRTLFHGFRMRLDISEFPHYRLFCRLFFHDRFQFFRRNCQCLVSQFLGTAATGLFYKKSGTAHPRLIGSLVGIVLHLRLAIVASCDNERVLRGCATVSLPINVA